MLLLLPALVLAAEPYEFTFPASEKALDLTASKGTLKLSTGGSAITIRGTHEGDQTMCQLQTSTDDGATARYEENGNSSVERDCITNMEVTVPALSPPIRLTDSLLVLLCERDSPVNASASA